MSSPAAERGREVRQKLLTAAAELIPERGWTAVSTRVLADRARVSPSVVHYHFPTMPALLNEAALGVIRQLVAELGGFLDTAPTPTDAIDAMLASVASYSGADPTSLLFIEAYLAATRDESLRVEINGVLVGFRRRFADFLARFGQDAPEETAAVLLATVDGLLLHRGLGAGMSSEPVGGVVRRIVEPGRKR